MDTENTQQAKCIFCDSAMGVAQEVDAKGQAFNCCGWCFAHVLHAIKPEDVTAILPATRKWLLGR